MNDEAMDDLDSQAIESEAHFPPIGRRIPLFLAASGLYTATPFRFRIPWYRPNPQPFPIPNSPVQALPGPQPSPEEGAESELRLAHPFWRRREELRLDVDGRYPQMTASGTLFQGFGLRAHWIASLTGTGPNSWKGNIWFRDGSLGALPHTRVEIQVVRSWFRNQRKATITFRGGGARRRVVTYIWESASFHNVEFEFDSATGTSAVTSIGTCDHPNGPAGIRCENLSIETVYRRAGFRVSKSGGDGNVPIGGAGANAKWSDMEMHDAMQTFWSRFDDRARWSMWVFFAKLHERGSSLGGIMFDDIGPNHRQGTAMFNDSFIKKAPAGDPNPGAWVKRMKFWTACHEMGHAFNLAHSWQKSHPPSWGTPWIPLANEPEARSWMNYPYNVAGGQTAFFADFEFRFSDSELLFMRHAPSRFVQMGNADWFDQHGFEQAALSPEPSFALELRVHRTTDYFEFLEPVSLELKLTNISGEPKVVEESILSSGDKITVVLKKEGKAARRWAPYATYLFEEKKTVLPPGASIYGALNVSAGLNGFDIAEPGRYVAQVALDIGGEDVVSNVLGLRVAPPRGYDEEFVAQDFFTEDVGRTIALNGSMLLTGANDILEEVVGRLGTSRVADHARLALANPLTRDYKSLVLPAGTRDLTSAVKDNGKFQISKAKPSEAREQMIAVLTDDASAAADTFGHIDYKSHVDDLSEFLHHSGDSAAAADCQATLHQTLTKRGVISTVLADSEKKMKTYGKKPRTKSAVG